MDAPSVSQSADPRILLLDTAYESCLWIGDRIRSWGYGVEATCDARQAVAWLEDSEFEVVVAETTSRGADGPHGVTVLGATRARAPHTPVIAFARDARVEDVLGAIRNGAFDFVTVDDHLEALHSAIRRALDHVRLVRENESLLRDLHRMNALLEQRVGERTHQLEEANERLTAERAELERTLQTLNDTQTQLVQAEKMASLGLLTAGVAHEINNPLGFVLPNFSVLEQWCDGMCRGEGSPVDAPPAEMLEVMRECHEGILRIREIVRDLGLYSRHTSSATERVDLHSTIESVCRLFGGQLRYRTLLRPELDDVPHVSADAGQLRQVVLNLLINAAHAVPDAARDGQIIVRTRHVADTVEVVVADNGVGIPAEILDKVFDPFFTTKPLGQGTGMGLPISRQLVESMGGTLRISSTVGRGTEVTITLRVWQDS